MTPAEPRNHYQTLRVDPHATPHRVRHAYRRMAQKFHPDKYAGRGDSAALMARINGAYAVLSDPARRAAYDASLMQQSARESHGARAATMAAGWQDRFGWSGWLLLAIASIAVLTLGYVMLKTLAPAKPVFQPPPLASAAPTVDNTPLVPVQAIEPWKEPVPQARPVNPATDPVARLVREGVITPAPLQRKDRPNAQ
jgi:hypothetical protein